MDKLRIKMCVEEGRYEEALQISVDCTPSALHRAHIRLLSKYRACAFTRELINQAKGRILAESALEKGRRFSRIGQKERAVALLTQALREGGEADDYLLTAQLLEQLWRVEAALEYFEAAVRIRGDAADKLWLACALERLSRFEEALAIYKEVVRQRGAAEDFTVWGSLLYRLGKNDEAEPVLMKAVSLGDRGMGVQLLQAIKTARGKARVRKLLSGIVSLLNGKSAETGKKDTGGVREEKTGDNG